MTTETWRSIGEFADALIARAKAAKSLEKTAGCAKVERSGERANAQPDLTDNRLDERQSSFD